MAQQVEVHKDTETYLKAVADFIDPGKAANDNMRYIGCIVLLIGKAITNEIAALRHSNEAIALRGGPYRT